MPIFLIQNVFILFNGQSLGTNLIVAEGYKLTLKINMVTYFKNLTVGLHVLYVLNTYIKFCVNWILFTIRSINLFFMHHFRLQKLEILTFE